MKEETKRGIINVGWTLVMVAVASVINKMCHLSISWGMFGVIVYQAYMIGKTK